jgi:transcriptional regulator with GAF, ATPase, and Fis domain
LASLANELTERPENLLQKLTETLIELRLADSAGVSLREKAEEGEQFRWAALAGRWGQFRGGVMQFDASPCGVVIECNAMLLFEHPQHFFEAAAVQPLIHEILLVPFHVQGRPVGTLRINAHDPGRKFDTEDVRLLRRLSCFASTGYQMNEALSHAHSGEAASRAALRESEERLTADIDAMQELQSISSDLVGEHEPQALYGRIVEAAMALMHSDTASIQEFHPETDRLEILTHRGLTRNPLHSGSGFRQTPAVPAVVRSPSANASSCPT